MTLPRFLPDLGLWFDWHDAQGTLPDQWKGKTLSEICRQLRVPHWRTVRPWRMEMPGITVTDNRGPTERTLGWETPDGTLISRWTLGPDGDWWRSEYPVKGPSDLKAAMAVARARHYLLSPDPADQESAEGLTALELPLRPWSELFHAFLGWSDGLMLFMEEPQVLKEIAAVLEADLAPLVEKMAVLPGDFVLSPDNLDGQFITPEVFQENFAPSYRGTAVALHGQGKQLIVHAGGPVRRLLAGLSDCGVDCVQGICGPPQGDSTLAEARGLCNSALGLWGGIAQDFLLADRTEREFEVAVETAFAEAVKDPHAIVGVADKVPVHAVPRRLENLARMAAGYLC
jgi:hypothetical protein